MLGCNLYDVQILHVKFFHDASGKTTLIWTNRWQGFEFEKQTKKTQKTKTKTTKTKQNFPFIRKMVGYSKI